mmetsp:Transcript_2882/g.4645  ORF Transcript_2882/g.4645 Transcript_2882/m.4645 type:complete len:263 (-) Transcript_2882:1251-2039(-)
MSERRRSRRFSQEEAPTERKQRCRIYTDSTCLSLKLASPAVCYHCSFHDPLKRGGMTENLTSRQRICKQPWQHLNKSAPSGKRGESDLLISYKSAWRQLKKMGHPGPELLPQNDLPIAAKTASKTNRSTIAAPPTHVSPPTAASLPSATASTATTDDKVLPPPPASIPTTRISERFGIASPYKMALALDLLSDITSPQKGPFQRELFKGSSVIVPSLNNRDKHLLQIPKCTSEASAIAFFNMTGCLNDSEKSVASSFCQHLL